MNRRKALVAKVMAQDRGANEVVVSLEDFFEGNTDLGSIGPNLGDEQPQIEEFYAVLCGIRDRDDVKDVLVRVYGIEDEEAWPYTDTVYVLSSASIGTVTELVHPLQPDEVYEGWMYDKPPAAPEIGPPFRAYSVWWD